MRGAAINIALCVAVALLSGIALILLVDGAMMANTLPEVPPFTALYALPAMGTLISMILLNMAAPDAMLGSGGGGIMADGASLQMAICARVYVVFMLLLGFVSLGGATWVSATIYNPTHSPTTAWPGVAVILHALLTLLAGGLFFMRPRPRVF